MRILAIDPGSEQSAYVVYEDGDIIEHDIVTNKILLLRLMSNTAWDSIGEMAIEMVASYGMPVGKSTFETCLWIGRFIQAWEPKPSTKVYRKTDICMHLCHSTRAKDSNIRQALIDRFGGKDKAIGGKKCPECKGKGWRGRGRLVCPKCKGAKWKHPKGPLFGVSKDVWSALAVAVCFEANYEHLQKQAF